VIVVRGRGDPSNREKDCANTGTRTPTSALYVAAAFANVVRMCAGVGGGKLVS
jgi:hypothetical protein